MEYHERHGHDVCSFDLPSTHRLPTVSAAQAFEDLDANVSRFVSTNLPDLDNALAASAAASSSSAGEEGASAGGIHKGHLTEIWGPPGVGKTAFGIQAAADVLQGGKGVVWVGPSMSSKRLQMLQYVVSALQKLAATFDAAVVILSQCATRMQAERGATLIPAINANVWEQGIATRVALLRDWMWDDGHPCGARLAAVQKVNGKMAADSMDRLFAFSIDSTGLAPAQFDGHAASSTLPGPKRKLGETSFEVVDSEDEDYGWQEKDSSLLPGMPPQWQGSEDLILGQPRHETEADSRVEDSELENGSLSDDER
ncbi:hypothetical protein DHEL01_v200483 [Diaporthe helianthi]|uniref:RecA family profile 1 domain-containing protein n=1 Tax=Diaporthe helianthi TaxID=158607 RepID=A0A2P5IF40_DIAHE|nr:hypothetical protein DHEL01_v200483 [Diaporthe helianthi]